MEPECDFVTISGGNGSRKLFLKSKCSTDELSLCHFWGQRCYFNVPIRNSAKSCTFFEVGLLLVGLFNRLFMTKCENDFWTGIKTNPEMSQMRISVFCYTSVSNHELVAYPFLQMLEAAAHLNLTVIPPFWHPGPSGDGKFSIVKL